MRILPRSFAIVGWVLAFGTGLLLAQTLGEIRGTVVDARGGGLPGATVEVFSPALQGSRTTVTGSGGAFQLPALPPGSYRVVVSLAGFGKAEQQTQVRLDATASVAITLQVAATEQIVVTGEAPVVDVSTTTGGSNYGSSVIDRLPVGRNYTDIVKSNPGVSQDRADRQGRAAALTVYGSTSAENSFIIDGVDTTNVIRGLQGKVDQQRVHRGGRGQDRQLPRGVRKRHRRNRQRDHEVGRQRLPRERVRPLQQRRAARRRGVHGQRLGHVHRDADPRRGEVGLRREPRRLLPQGPRVVLRRVQPRHRQPDDLSAPRRRRRAGVSPGLRVQPLVRKVDLERHAGRDPRRDGVLGSDHRGRRDPDPQLDGSGLLPGTPRHRRRRLRRPRQHPLRLRRPPDAAGIPPQRPLRADRHGRGQRDPVHRRDRAAALPGHRRAGAHQRLSGFQQEPPEPVPGRLRRLLPRPRAQGRRRLHRALDRGDRPYSPAASRCRSASTRPAARSTMPTPSSARGSAAATPYPYPSTTCT